MMAAPVERGKGISRGQAIADDQNAVTRGDIFQRSVRIQVRHQFRMAGKRFQHLRKRWRRMARRNHHDIHEVAVAVCGLQLPTIRMAGHMFHRAAPVLNDARIQQRRDLGRDIGAEDPALRIGLPIGQNRCCIARKRVRPVEIVEEIIRIIRIKRHAPGRHVDPVGRLRRGIGKPRAQCRSRFEHHDPHIFERPSGSMEMEGNRCPAKSTAYDGDNGILPAH